MLFVVSEGCSYFDVERDSGHRAISTGSTMILQINVVQSRSGFRQSCRTANNAIPFTKSVLQTILPFVQAYKIDFKIMRKSRVSVV